MIYVGIYITTNDLGFFAAFYLKSNLKGVKNLMECPKQPKIPIYLFVGGAFGLVKLIQTLYDQWRIRKKEKFDQNDLADATGFESGEESGISGLSKSSRFIDIVISLFLFVWFCFGNYWVRIYTLFIDYYDLGLFFKLKGV